MHEMLKAKHGYIYSLFIEVKMMHYIIYYNSSKQHTMSISIVASSNMEAFKSDDMFPVAKGSHVGILTFYYI